MARETDDVKRSIETEVVAELKARKATWPADMRHRFQETPAIRKTTAAELRERRRHVLKVLRSGPWPVDSTPGLANTAESPHGRESARRTLDALEALGLVERFDDVGRESWRLVTAPKRVPTLRPKTPEHHDCTVMRTMLVCRGTIDLNTGEDKMDDGTWETRPCGTPLFEPNQRKTGVCSSCAKGWNHPENYRADGPRPEKATE